MRAITVCVLALLLSVASAERLYASEGFEDLAKLVKSGVNEDAILAYVQSSPTNYVLTVSEILFLSDLGLSTETIEAINASGQGPSAIESNVVAEADTALVADSVPPPPVELPTEGAVLETFSEAPEVTVPPSDNVDYTTFYDSLSPYGTWISWDGVWCWQPTAILIDPGWQPYCHRGHWEFTDCGWAWRSSYSWGWAPFHYGRWRRHDHYGWLWSPGNVWGPAWVSWRYSQANIGWAPLPPEADFEFDRGLCFKGREIAENFDFGLAPSCYTFVPVSHFCLPDVARYRFRRDQTAILFPSVTVIQNHYRFQDHRVFNEGPPIQQITAVTHVDLRPLRIIDQPLRAGDRIRPASRSSTTLAFFRPQVTATARETPIQLAAHHLAREEARRETVSHDNLIGTYQNVRSVLHQQTRGRTSLAPAPSVRESAPARAPDVRTQKPSPDIEDAARQRQAEEQTARQRVERQRQADQLIQRQSEARRQAQEAAQQRGNNEQTQRNAESARQLEAQRRSEENARQQDLQRQQEEVRRSQAVAQQQENLRQEIRTRRESEELAARQQMESRRVVEPERPREIERPAPVVHPPAETMHNRAPPPPVPVQSQILQGYDSSRMTGSDSRRGADSRGASYRNFEQQGHH